LSLQPLIATLVKELRLLVRDRSGLLVLFVMPAVLVVVVSLVQENVLKATGAGRMDVLFIDQDRQTLGPLIRTQLEATESLRLITELDGRAIEVEHARRLVDQGAFEVCIVVPEGLTAAVRTRAGEQLSDAFEGEALGGGLPPSRLSVYFDPLVQGAFRSSLLNALGQMLLAMELEIKARALSEALPARVRQALSAATGRMTVDPSLPTVRLDPSWGARRLMAVGAEQSRLKTLPTSVQQNVAAYSVFGIFFIVLPLGGSFIRERQDGTLTRLRTLPVGYLTILAGKLGAYVAVCWGQFLFIVLVGTWGLPLLGTPALTLGVDRTALAVTVTLVAFAACGYGLMLGTLARTLEQASMFGAVSVVCAAAVGGIMVPVYVMPPAMQTISALSPLAWGLNALVEIAVREGTLGAVRQELLWLAVFTAGTVAIAWGCFGRYDRPGQP
jgi:ABC-2 type transport system permease protein